MYNLKGHIECSTPLVSSNLQPDLVGWYKPFMPGKPASSATMFLTTIVFYCLKISLSYFSFPSKSCTTLSTSCGMYTKGAPFDFLSTRWNWKRKQGYLSLEVITNNLAGNVAHPFLTSQTDAGGFEPPEIAVS